MLGISTRPPLPNCHLTESPILARPDSSVDRSPTDARSLLELLQVVFIAKILIYFAGLENARRHWMRVIVYAVVITGIVWCFQWCFGEAVASFFLKARSM